MSIPSPSKWSGIMSVISSFASKPNQTQASRHTCGTELCTCHLPSPSKWSEILSVISSLAPKTMPSFVGGTLGGTLVGRASDDERSESFKMVRDTVRYKQFCIKTVSNTSIKTHMPHLALHMSSSKSFKMVRDIVLGAS